MTGSLRFTVTIEMQSDWVVGSGSGRQGAIDSLIERDEDGLPFVPSTTLRGIWRDAAEQLAFALDGGRDGAWAGAAAHLFGSQPAIEQSAEPPGSSQLSVADARFPAAIRNAVADSFPAGERRLNKRAVRDAFAYVKPGVRIDRHSGRAKSEQLRFDEVARKGAVLEADGAIILSGQGDEALVAMAFAATRLIERIGGGRRRGLGRCKLSITPKPAAPALPATIEAAIERLRSTPPARAPRTANAPVLTTYTKASDASFNVVDLTIELLGPTVIADAVLGNVVTTLDFIPGSLLLAPAAELSRRLGVATDATWAGLAAGDIRILPATPEVPHSGGKGGRGLPTPLGFPLRKGERQGYVRIAARGDRLTVDKVTPRKIVRTHNTVDDDRQKPSEEVGGVYVYEALEPGLKLRSELWIRETLCDAATLRAGVARQSGEPRLEASVGRAKRAGYGRIAIGAAWGVAPRRPDVKGDSATLYFETDALLPAGLAAGPQDFLAAELAEYGASDVRIECGDLRTGRQDGWLVLWGLPRTSFVTIAAGSTVRIAGSKLDVALPAAGVEGIGARRGEGFGRVRVNDPLVTSDVPEIKRNEKTCKNAATPRDAATGAEKLSITDQAKGFLVAVERQAVTKAVQLAAEVAANNADKRKTVLAWRDDAPSMSQLGALRGVMNRLAGKDDRSSTLKFLKNLKGSDREQRWGEEPVKRLIDLFEKPESIWPVIGLDDTALIGASAITPRAALREEHCDLALASYLAAAMQAHKRQLEKS